MLEVLQLWSLLDQTKNLSETFLFPFWYIYDNGTDNDEQHQEGVLEQNTSILKIIELHLYFTYNYN